VAFVEEATVEWVGDGDGVDRDGLLGFLENALLHVLQRAVAAP
jgi:hypothetical protein